MSTHRVLANKGFISGPMSALAAYRYSYQLKVLGNEMVMVRPTEEAQAYQSWKER